MALSTRGFAMIEEGMIMRLRGPARRFVTNPLAVAGLLVLLGFSLAAILAPWVAPFAPDQANPRLMLKPPSAVHLLGTDDIGRDVLSRLLFAGRISLALGAGVAVVAVSIGVIIGAVAGYFGGWVDRIVSAFIDTMLALPLIPVAMVLGAFIELTTLSLVLMLSAFSWQTVARMVRGQILSLKQWPYVEAARAVGATSWRILFRHMVPGTLSPVFVSATLLVAQAILIESALSFLGFGVRPPTATWGNMLNVAQVYVREAPWLGIYPGLAITATVASMNFVGETLRRSLDPRMRMR